MVRFRLEVDTRALLSRIEEIREVDVPDARERFVRSVTRDVLRQTIVHNPVETGRARGAWVQSLEALGGQAPAGWKGSQPEDSAISEGRGLSELDRDESRHTHDVRATSHVRYVNYLEFGTRKMSAFEMVRLGMDDVRPSVGSRPFFCAPDVDGVV